MQTKPSLLFPFTVCKSHGGRLDDRSFVLGVQFGAAHSQMVNGEPLIEGYYDSELTQQIDLAAMHSGYLMRSSVDSDTPEWTYIWLVRQPRDGDLVA